MSQPFIEPEKMTVDQLQQEAKQIEKGETSFMRPGQKDAWLARLEVRALKLSLPELAWKVAQLKGKGGLH